MKEAFYMTKVRKTVRKKNKIHLRAKYSGIVKIFIDPVGFICGSRSIKAQASFHGNVILHHLHKKGMDCI